MMLPPIVEIARQELLVILRTKRALLVAGLYLALAILGGSGYVVAVRVAEKTAIDTLMGLGTSEEAAIEQVKTGSDTFYAQLASWFAGADLSAIAPAIRDSVILPAFFWCSLALLPLVIILTSFDQLCIDIGSRSITYHILRARRDEVVLGKLLAHSAVLVGITALSAAVLVATASAALETVEFGASVLGLLRVWLLLVPFGLVYLSLAAAASVTGSSFRALFVGVSAVIGLRVCGMMDLISEESSWAPLRHLRWLSPATYHPDLWLQSWGAVATSVGIYLTFAVVLTGIAIFRLEQRDL